MPGFNPTQPYNTLPTLPPAQELETRAIWKLRTEARVALAELKQVGELIPNQSVLINTIPLLEAQASSEIENIVTTSDQLFRFADTSTNHSVNQTDPAIAEAWATENQFFEFISRGEGKGYNFKKLARYDELIAGLFATLKSYQQQLTRVIDLINPKDSRETELLATIHAGWHNLIIEGGKITDEAIIKEAREKWHVSKMKMPVAEFQQALRFIRRKGLESDGSAKRVGG